MTNRENKLSVVIITKNEENCIAAAVRSSLFADEVLILDSRSTDRTCEIAEAAGAKIYVQDWAGFGRQKKAAVNLARNKWVFVLDADEQISEELQAEILKILQKPASEGYFVPRLNNFWGKNIRTCGLYPDYSLRLFDRTAGNFDEAAVHESVRLATKPGRLKQAILHAAYENVAEFIEKQNRYSSLNAKQNRKPVKAVFSPVWTFFKLFVLKKGFLDGMDGFIICKLYAQYTFWKYIK